MEKPFFKLNQVGYLPTLSKYNYFKSFNMLLNKASLTRYLDCVTRRIEAHGEYRNYCNAHFRKQINLN
jgi:hypothetical protein